MFPSLSGLSSLASNFIPPNLNPMNMLTGQGIGPSGIRATGAMRRKRARGIRATSLTGRNTRARGVHKRVGLVAKGLKDGTINETEAAHVLTTDPIIAKNPDVITPIIETAKELASTNPRVVESLPNEHVGQIVLGSNPSTYSPPALSPPVLPPPVYFPQEPVWTGKSKKGQGVFGDLMGFL